MKKLTFIILLASSISQADVILSVTGKYGPNGYSTSSTSSPSALTTSTTTSKNHKSTTTTSTISSPDVDTHVENRMQLVPGLRLQTVPEPLGLSLGVGYFFDNTYEASLGIRF